jgi:hypothetical protein
MKILPGTGRATATRSSVVEGARGTRYGKPRAPSTTLRVVPLPVPGRIEELR